METASQHLVHNPSLLGSHLRTLRQQREMTVERLAGEVGLSKGYISLVESGKRAPHWSTLMRLVHALDETLCSFLQGSRQESPEREQQKIMHARREELIVVNGAEPDEWGLVPNADEDGYTWILTPHSRQEQSMVVRFRLPPHTSWTPGTITFPASAVAFGLEGVMLFEANEQRRDEHLLAKGEILQFNGSQPHRFRNHTDEPAEALMTISPARF